MVTPPISKGDTDAPARADVPTRPASELATNDGGYIDTDQALFPLSPHLSDSADAAELYYDRSTSPIPAPDGLHDSTFPMDIDALPDDTQPLPVKQEMPEAPGSPNVHPANVIDVSDIDFDIVDNLPAVKSELDAATESEPTTETIAEVSHEPMPTDAPVKDEVPTLQHTINNNAPVLQGENGEDVLREVLQKESKLKKPADLKTLVERLKSTFPEGLEDDMLKEFAKLDWGLPAQHARDAQIDITRQAKDLLTMSNEKRAAHMESLMGVVQTAEQGRGVVAKRDIDAYEVLGPYAGKWLDSEGQKREEARVGEGKLYSYSFNVPNKNAIISGFGEGHGNLTTLLNDADNPVDNNVAHIWLGKNLVFLVTTRKVPAGKQLLLDYGGTYDRSGWESHPIKVEPDDPVETDQ